VITASQAGERSIRDLYHGDPATRLTQTKWPAKRAIVAKDSDAPPASGPAYDPAFKWNGGVRVANSTLWCDAPRPQPHGFVFISHAGAPWPRRAGLRLITTERTRALGRALALAGSVDSRQGAAPSLVTPFGRPFSLGRARLELLPSGHAPGAAQVFVEVDGRRVCYAGPLNPMPGRLCEPPQVRGCDALAVEAPLAAFNRPLPPRAESEAQLVAAVQAALADRELPIVLTALGCASLEVITLLAAAGVRLRVPARTAALLDAAARLAIAVPAEVKQFRGHVANGEALIWPLQARHAPALARLRQTRRILAAGAALDPDAAARFGVAIAVPLADHGDLPSLLAHVRASDARDVYFTAGFSDEVARACAAAGVRAHALGPPRRMHQMTLFGSG
jgi:putative mRNA 3-end processing factor